MRSLDECDRVAARGGEVFEIDVRDRRAVLLFSLNYRQVAIGPATDL